MVRQYLLGRGGDARGVGGISVCTMSRPGCSAAIRSSSSARRPPMMTALPFAWSSKASAKPIPLVEPGMKTVFRGDIHLEIGSTADVPILLS
jgi:hypothetical protein